MILTISRPKPCSGRYQLSCVQDGNTTILTSSDDAVCRSTALENRSSRTVNTPSPSKTPWRHPRNLRTNLTSLQDPLSRYPWITAPARLRMSWVSSCLCGLACRTIAATKGILKGCSTTLPPVSTRRCQKQSGDLQLHCKIDEAVPQLFILVVLSHSLRHTADLIFCPFQGLFDS